MHSKNYHLFLYSCFMPPSRMTYLSYMVHVALMMFCDVCERLSPCVRCLLQCLTVSYDTVCSGGVIMVTSDRTRQFLYSKHLLAVSSREFYERIE